jgi:hypothetical protein
MKEQGIAWMVAGGLHDPGQQTARQVDASALDCWVA